MSLRKLLAHAATRAPLDRLWGWARRGAVPILMLHRFHPDSDTGPGLRAGLLREALHTLRHRGVSFLALDETLALLQRGQRVPKSVIFTVDDGYKDFFSVALPIFAEFGCPVTVFLTTGFVDGAWQWWDRVTHTFAVTGLDQVTIPFPDGHIAFRRDPPSWAPHPSMLVEQLKSLAEPVRLRALADVETACQVQLPKHPPPAYQSMSWEDIRHAASQGITFGAHTVTHPILSRTDQVQAQQEIINSRDRIHEMLPPPAISRVFCYPNGLPTDFSQREEQILFEAGFSGGLTTTPGYASVGSGSKARGQYRIPRFAFPDSIADLLQITTGVEALKMGLRGKRNR